MRTAFTLIELLVVIAILSVLAVVVILTLNPAGLLQESRDTNRISDMATLNSGISLFSADVQTANALGLANTVYVSIPDPAATSTAGDQCQGLNLLALPSTYTYHCSAPTNYRLTNGTGWLPLNFASATFASPFAQLPVDPTNTSSSHLYYAYTTNGTQYEVTSFMESTKYKLGGTSDVITPDGGTLASVYEKGSRLGLEPLDYGDPALIGYWTFDEGQNSTAYDYSGNNIIGTWNGTQAGTNGYYSSGKIGNFSGYFNGGNDYVGVGTGTLAANFPQLTVSVWANPSSVPSYIGNVVGNARDCCGNYYGYSIWTQSGTWHFQVGDGTTFHAVFNATSTLNVWSYLDLVYNGSSLLAYVNGQLVGSVVSGIVQSSTLPIEIGGSPWSGTWGFPGLIDDVRIYNRALSAAEIQAIYNGGK